MDKKERLKYFEKPFFNISRSTSLVASQILKPKIQYNIPQMQYQVQPIVQRPQQQMFMPRLLIRRPVIRQQMPSIQRIQSIQQVPVIEEDNSWHDIGSEKYP
jgi:hypothetical protein